MKELVIFLVFLMSSGGSCESAPPFEYANNSRVVVEAYLVDENMNPLKNQSVALMSYDKYQRIILNQVRSDERGKVFITSPKGNRTIFLEFSGQKIIYATNYPDLVHANNNYEDWIGDLSGSYYNFGIISLKPKA